MLNNDELKPCPFCGGEAVLETERECYGHGEYHNRHFVRCKMCGARGSSQVEYSMHPDCCKVIVKNKWNRRNGENK